MLPLNDLLSEVVDNRGRTCPTSDTGIPLIATNCVRNDRLYPAFDKVRYVSHDTYNTWFRGHPEPGDILFVNKGTPGRVCMVPDPVDFCIAQDMVSLRADTTTIDPLYLFAALRSPQVQSSVANMHVGTLIPHFKKGDFDKVRIPVPKCRELQKAIGQVYFTFCEKVDLHDEMSRTLEEIARAIFKSWFVDFDPVRAKAEGRDPGLPDTIADLFPNSFQESELGEIPKGWVAGRLGDIISIHDSKRIPLSKKQRSERQGSFRYYGAAGIIDHVDKFLFDGVHVLVGEDGSVVDDAGKPVVQYVWGQFWVNNHAHVLKGEQGVSQEQLFLAVQQIDIKPFVTGAVQPKLNQTNMKAVPMVIAPQDLNLSFGEVVGPLFERRRAALDESLSLIALRDALLPKLISSELRIPDAERIVGRIA